MTYTEPADASRQVGAIRLGGEPYTYQSGEDAPAPKQKMTRRALEARQASERAEFGRHRSDYWDASQSMYATGGLGDLTARFSDRHVRTHEADSYDEFAGGHSKLIQSG